MSKPYSSALQMEVRPKAFCNDYGPRANVSRMMVSFRKEMQMLIFTAHVYFPRTPIRLYRAVTQTGEKGEQQLFPTAEKQEVESFPPHAISNPPPRRRWERGGGVVVYSIVVVVVHLAVGRTKGGGSGAEQGRLSPAREWLYCSTDRQREKERRKRKGKTIP